MFGPVYAAIFNAVAVTAAQDAFEIVAPKNANLRLLRVLLGQYSEAGDAAAEMLGVQIIRGYTTSGSGGSAVTPRPFNSYMPAAGATVEANNTTVAADGTAHVLVSESFNVQAGWYWDAPPVDPAMRYQGFIAAQPRAGLSLSLPGQMIVKPSERLVVRITAPADEITLNGTLVFEELPWG